MQVHRFIAVAALIAVMAAAATAEESNPLEAVVDSASVTTAARPLKRTAPRYPARSLRDGKQGWVKLAFCIDESGVPQNISVIDSVGPGDFTRAAIRTLEDWEYQPATVNGQPSWQSRNEVAITFAVEGGNTGATRRFATRYRQLQKLIEQGELEKADEVFWSAYETLDLSLYELSKLWALRVQYEVRMGDLHRLNQALYRATMSKGQFIDAESYHKLLNLRVKVELKTQRYGSAIASFEELLDSAGEDSAYVSDIANEIEHLERVVEGDATLVVSAAIRDDQVCQDCSDHWTFAPVRREFSVVNVEGQIDSVLMRCDHRRFESDVTELVEWHIPESWGNCRVDFFGPPGTSFDVHLLPSA